MQFFSVNAIFQSIFEKMVSYVISELSGSSDKLCTCAVGYRMRKHSLSNCSSIENLGYDDQAA